MTYIFNSNTYKMVDVILAGITNKDYTFTEVIEALTEIEKVYYDDYVEYKAKKYQDATLKYSSLYEDAFSLRELLEMEYGEFKVELRSKLRSIIDE